MNDQSTITFSPSDIDQNPQAPAAKAQPTQNSVPITFSPSDIDHNAPIQQTSTSSGSSYQPESAATGSGGASDQDPATANGQGGDPISGGIAEGLADFAKPIVQAISHPIQTIWNMLPPVQLTDSTKQSLSVINAYERARSGGASVGDAIKAADIQARQQDSTSQLVQQRVAEFKKNPTQQSVRALTDAAALAASIWGGGEGAVASEVPEASLPEDVAMSESAPNVAEDPLSVETPASPKDVFVKEYARKSGLPTGEDATVARSYKSIQPGLQQGIRDVINRTAQEDGLNPIDDFVSTRDAAQDLADQYKARSQDTFDRVEDITNIDVTALKDRIAALDDKITDLAITDPERAGQLYAQKLDYETQAEQAFKDAKAQGVDVGQARQDWRSNVRATELSNKIRNADEGTIGKPIINPNKLTKPLQKMYDFAGGKKGGLQDLLGDENAKELVQHVENARTATEEIKNFTPKAATGQKAFSKILSDNTIEKNSIIPGKGTVAKTDWNGVVKDLGNLSPEEARASFGRELSQVKQFAASQARKQLAINIAKGVGASAAAGAVGKLGWDLF